MAGNRVSARLVPETTRSVGAELVTQRGRCTRFTAEDVDELIALEGDPRVMRFLDRGPRSRTQIEATRHSHGGALGYRLRMSG